MSARCFRFLCFIQISRNAVEVFAEDVHEVCGFQVVLQLVSVLIQYLEPQPRSLRALLCRQSLIRRKPGQLGQRPRKPQERRSFGKEFRTHKAEVRVGHVAVASFYLVAF